MADTRNKADGISRREFATRIGAAAAGVAVGGEFLTARTEAAHVGSRILGANDRVVTASIGIRGQGNSLKRGFARLKNVEIKTLCDIDANPAPSRINDERLKDVAGRYDRGLDRIMRLAPIRYRYKRDNAIGIRDGREHVGFGAQAVERVIPEAVQRSPSGYLTVDNDPILWTMLNAIKEQQMEIAELRRQVRRLREAGR